MPVPVTPILAYASPTTAGDPSFRYQQLARRRRFLAKVRWGLLAVVVMLFFLGLATAPRGALREAIVNLLFLSLPAYILIASLGSAGTFLGILGLIACSFLLLFAEMLTVAAVVDVLHGRNGGVAVIGVGFFACICVLWQAIHKKTWPALAF